MKSVFVDTNIFLRFFTKDDSGQHKQAATLLKNANNGKIRLVCGPPVLFELAWTLKSAYKQSADKILAAIEAVAAFPGITLTDQEIVLRAVQLARRFDQEFADSYIAASAEAAGIDEIATFNTKHFNRLPLQLHRM